MAFDIDKLKQSQEFYRKDNYEDLLLSEFLKETTDFYNKKLNLIDFEDDLQEYIEYCIKNGKDIFTIELICGEGEFNRHKYTTIEVRPKDFWSKPFFIIEEIEYNGSMLSKKLCKELAKVCNKYLCIRLEGLKLNIIDNKENGFLETVGYKVKFKL